MHGELYKFKYILYIIYTLYTYVQSLKINVGISRAPLSRKYQRYRVGTHTYVSCQETKIVNGVLMKCKFRNKREDHFKELLKQNKLHQCSFEPAEKQTKSVADYFTPISNRTRSEQVL